MKRHPGKTIRKLIDERGMSEGALSKASGVTQPTIHRIITGESKDPRRSNLERIARVFGLEVEDLYVLDLAINPAKIKVKGQPVELKTEAGQFANLPKTSKAKKLVSMLADMSPKEMDMAIRILSAIRESP